MATAGESSASRSKRRRAPRPRAGLPTPVEVGQVLHQARERAGLTLADVHDRTGVPWRHLEALEKGSADAFPDENSALLALRRVAELVETEVAPLSEALSEHWRQAALVAAGRHQATSGWVDPSAAPAVGPGGHLSRFPGDMSHLRAFTSTDQTRAVSAGSGRPSGPGSPSDEATMARSRHPSTGVYPVVNVDSSLTGSYPAVIPLNFGPVRPPPPLALRVSIWVVCILLAVGGAGLVIHHFEPAWLVDAHLVASASHRSGSSGASGSHAGSSGTSGSQGRTHPSTPGGTASSGSLTAVPTGAATGTVTVRTAGYTVVVNGLQPAWIQVTTPASATPVFSGIVTAGQTKVFTPDAGQLIMSFGGAQITVQVDIGGKAVPGWQFKPTVVPYTLTFTARS